MNEFEPWCTTGFPSPGAMWREQRLSLDDLLKLHRPSVFFARVSDRSMQGVGLFPGDLVMVDRSLSVVHGSVILANLNGGWTIKRVLFVGETILLQSEHHRYPTFQVRAHMQFQIFGVVVCVLHGVHPTLTLDALIEQWGKEHTP